MKHLTLKHTKHLVKHLPSLFLGLLLCLAVQAQPQEHTANSPEKAAGASQAQEQTTPLREFDAETLDDLRDDRAFDYVRDAKPKLNLRGTLLRRFLKWWSSLFETQDQRRAADWIFGILFVGVLIFAIALLFRVDARSLFYRKSHEEKDRVGELSIEDDIHGQNWAKLLAGAESQQDYRLAVRYSYLLALKRLTDLEQLEWFPGKTHRDYATELEDATLRRAFEGLGYYFAYAWYGEFTVGQAQYRKVQSFVAQLKKAKPNRKGVKA